MKTEADGGFPRLKCNLLILFALLFLPTILAVKAQPANDNFANRELINRDNVTISGSLYNATFEADEPMLEGISSGQTAWWTWVAPTNGIVNLTVNGTGFSPLLMVFTGDAPVNLSLIANNTFLACYEYSDCGCHWRFRNQCSVHVVGGVPYQIAVDSGINTDSTRLHFTEAIAYTNGSYYVHPLPGSVQITNTPPVDR